MIVSLFFVKDFWTDHFAESISDIIAEYRGNQYDYKEYANVKVPLRCE